MEAMLNPDWKFWTFENSVYATRQDGVIASFVFGGTRPFAVKRRKGKTFEWLAGRSVSTRTFGTIETAMKAADKSWPLKKAKK